MSALPQQPREIADILSASVKLYAESFTKVVGYSLIVFVLNRLFEFFIPVVDTTLETEEQMMEMLQMLPNILGIVFVSILLSCVFYGAMIYRIDNLANEREDNFVEVLLLAVKKFPTIIVAAILYTIAITIGSVLLVIPGIILMISMSFCGYFILLENKDGYGSLIASHRLVWGDWWRTNWVFFVPTLIFFIVFSIIGFFSGIFDVEVETSTAVDIGTNLLVDLVTPYFYVLGYLQYHDLKLRKNI